MAECSIRCFGVGDGWPCADRHHSSFLYRFGETSILVDCGEPISSSYKASGLSYDAIDQILLSHLHSDHVGGFFMLMQGFWLEARTKPLTVSLPKDGIKPIQRLLELSTVFPELLDFKLKFEALKVARVMEVGEVRITPFPTTHLEQLRHAFQKRYPHRFEAFSFLLEAGKKRVAHSADIGKPEDLEPLLKKPLDLLVCELAHFQVEDLLAYLAGRPIKQILFMHVGRAQWANMPKTKRLVAKLLPDIPCTFAGDNEVYRF